MVKTKFLIYFYTETKQIAVACWKELAKLITEHSESM